MPVNEARTRRTLPRTHLAGVDSVVTAQSLKTKYALTALGIGAVVALLLAGVLFWQYRLDATRLSALAYHTVEETAGSELLVRGNTIANDRVAAPRTAHEQAHDWAGAHERSQARYLRISDVAAVELKD